MNINIIINIALYYILLCTVYERIVVQLQEKNVNLQSTQNTNMA